MLYVTCRGELHNSHGVVKKIYAQARVFSANLNMCICSDHYYGMACFWKEGDIVYKTFALSQKDYYDACLEWIVCRGDKYVYIRFCPPTTIWLIDFLKALKTRNIKAVIEFPTFPYEKLISNWRKANVFFEDELFRMKMKDYLDFGVAYNPVTMVYGIPVIEIQNGIDIDEHPARHMKQKGKKIVMLAVASMLKVHGYERVLEGMKKYYQNRNSDSYRVSCFLVGGSAGTELGYYKKLVYEFGLEEYVTFCGDALGQKLDEYYDTADIGVGPLGLYKISNLGGSPIKIREYCVRGLPFIYGYEENGFSGDEEYVLKVANDDSPVDINEVIKLYERTCGRQDIINTMRDYASKNCSWGKMMGPVIDYYNNG